MLACYRGVLVAVEVKIGRDRLRPEQEGFLANIRHVGGRAFVAKTYPDFLVDWARETVALPPLSVPSVVS